MSYHLFETNKSQSFWDCSSYFHVYIWNVFVTLDNEKILIAGVRGTWIFKGKARPSADVCCHICLCLGLHTSTHTETAWVWEKAAFPLLLPSFTSSVKAQSFQQTHVRKRQLLNVACLIQMRLSLIIKLLINNVITLEKVGFFSSYCNLIYETTNMSSWRCTEQWQDCGIISLEKISNVFNAELFLWIMIFMSRTCS